MFTINEKFSIEDPYNQDLARIALERRKSLKNAETAVERQAMWSNLAHEMTTEFRGLCAEEAYLQQELEKLHDLRNKVKLDGEHWDDIVSSSSQNSHLVSKATRFWESILAYLYHQFGSHFHCQHEVLASREHRYRISGSSLLAAMDQSSQVPNADVLSVQSGDFIPTHVDDKEQSEGSYVTANREKMKNRLDSAHLQVNDETSHQADETSRKVHPTVDVIRRWTHALQRVHKQSLHVAKAHEGEGPEILKTVHEGSSRSHTESLAATPAEHQQHLVSFQVLINQLKEIAPAIQKSISPTQVQSSGRTLENPTSSTDDVAEVTSKLSTFQLDKVSASPPAPKLPQLFSLTPNSYKRLASAAQISQIENISERKPLEQPLSNNHIDNLPQDSDSHYVQNLERSIREAALSRKSLHSESSQGSHSDESSEHFFMPLSSSWFSRLGPESKGALLNSSLHDYDQVNGFLSVMGSNSASSDAQRSFYDFEEAREQVFSPPMPIENAYEDLLAPLSETEAAIMEH